LIEQVYLAFERQALVAPQAEREPNIDHHNQANDLKRGVKVAE
jgi:hypothetical protein